jgi:hypothetical protein
MGKRKANAKDVYEKAQLISSGKLSFATNVLMKTRRGGLRAGYLNKLARQEKRVRAQSRSDNSGSRIREWDRGY